MMTHKERRIKFQSTQLGWKVGHAIRDYKKEHKLNNQDLAEIFDCNSATVSKWCKHNRDMRLDSFLTVVKGLELDLGELFEKYKMGRGFMKYRVGIYPGSFNPWHKGHEDILHKALKSYDFVQVLICTNPEKTIFENRFVKEEAKKLSEHFGTLKASAIAWDDTLIEAVKEFRASGVIRGLRNGHDLQYEINQQYWNEDIGIDAPFTYFITDRSLSHVSSSAIRAVEKIGLEHGYRTRKKIQE